MPNRTEPDTTEPPAVQLRQTGGPAKPDNSNFASVLVADLRHFMDMPDDVPGPARKLGEQLARIIRAGTAGHPGRPWTSALACTRRPQHPAQANHEDNRRHQKRFDDAFTALQQALDQLPR